MCTKQLDLSFLFLSVVIIMIWKQSKREKVKLIWKIFWVKKKMVVSFLQCIDSTSSFLFDIYTLNTRKHM